MNKRLIVLKLDLYYAYLYPRKTKVFFTTGKFQYEDYWRFQNGYQLYIYCIIYTFYSSLHLLLMLCLSFSLYMTKKWLFNNLFISPLNPKSKGVGPDTGVFFGGCGTDLSKKKSQIPFFWRAWIRIRFSCSFDKVIINI